MNEPTEIPGQNTQWPIWEAFVQLEWGKPHIHAGSLHAPDPEMALQNARDLYGRREIPKSIWVVPSGAISATKLSDEGPFFDAMDDKPYLHPRFYKVPKGVRNL